MVAAAAATIEVKKPKAAPKSTPKATSISASAPKVEAAAEEGDASLVVATRKRVVRAKKEQESEILPPLQCQQL
jgi:hypothetical protein